MGEVLEGVSTDMDTYSLRQPLGVVAGICPFNFPAMIPLWVKWKEKDEQPYFNNYF